MGESTPDSISSDSKLSSSTQVAQSFKLYHYPSAGEWVIGLARSKKLHYADQVASGVFPPHPLPVVPLAIQILVKEG